MRNDDFQQALEREFTDEELEDMSDADIEEFRQNYYNPNRQRVQRRSRRGGFGGLYAILGLVLLGAIIIGIGVWTFNQFSGGTVSINPTAAAMYTESSQILTQVVDGQQAIMAGSTPAPAAVEGSPMVVTPFAQSCKRTITDLGMYEESQSYFYTYAEDPGMQSFVDAQTWSTLQRGQVLDYCNN